MKIANSIGHVKNLPIWKCTFNDEEWQYIEISEKPSNGKTYIIKSPDDKFYRFDEFKGQVEQLFELIKTKPSEAKVSPYYIHSFYDIEEF